MTRKHKIIAGLEDAVAFVNGDMTRGTIHSVSIPSPIDVRQIRAQMGLAQEEFARRFGFSLGTLRNWEQGHRQPTGAARVLLTLIERLPSGEIEKALERRVM